MVLRVSTNLAQSVFCFGCSCCWHCYIWAITHYFHWHLMQWTVFFKGLLSTTLVFKKEFFKNADLTVLFITMEIVSKYLFGDLSLPCLLSVFHKAQAMTLENSLTFVSIQFYFLIHIPLHNTTGKLFNAWSEYF